MDYGIPEQSVDFIVNTFERTYRKVLCPGFVPDLAGQHCYPFSRRIVMINNVNDRGAAEDMAQSLKDSGEISDYFFVADLLAGTLHKAGLTMADLEPNVHYTDCSLCAIFLDGSDYLVYCDVDVRMKEARDWVAASIARMREDSRIAVANPDWTPSTLLEEAREFEGDFVVGYGFSDQLYLLRRSEFARPIYKFHAPISLRYPMSAEGRIFEQMVDSYMRVNRRMRATQSTASYIHDAVEGAGYSRLRASAKVRRLRNSILLRILKVLGLKHPLYHI